LREMLVNEFEKLLAVFDMNFKIHFKRWQWGSHGCRSLTQNSSHCLTIY
jgi:hypothetical protein